MTTLRTFQNEIDEIHTRELSKQRAQTLIDKEKDSKHQAKGKGRERIDESAKVSKGRGEIDESAKVSRFEGMQEIEERILVHTSATLDVLMLTILLDTSALPNSIRPRRCSRSAVCSPNSK